jgi:hypothetical protein
MIARRSATLVLGACLLAAFAIDSHAVEDFIPQGQAYGPGDDTLPPLNSRKDYINGRTDIYQTEIYRSHENLKMFDTEINRFIQHDLNPGPAIGPQY